MGDYLQQLYQGLKAKNPQMPDYDHFKADMNDEENRTKLYEVLKLKNPKLPDFRTFSQDMGFISSKPRGVLDGGDLVDLDQVQPQSSGFWNDYVAEPLKRIGVDAGKLENERVARNHEVEKEGGFWGSYAGDLIEKIGAGASNFGGTMYSAFDKLTSQDDLYRKQREVSLNDSPALKKYFDEHGVPENERSVFVGNNFLKGEADNAYQYADILRNRAERNSGKGFAELWKEGDYRGAVGDVFLQATESLPQSLMAMFGGGAGLALTGVSSGVNKYDQLDKTPDGKDMPEFSKVVNAVSTGTFEALSEKLGDVPIGRWLTDVYKNVGADVAKKSIKEGVSGWMQGMYKRYGVLIAPVSEGVEEVASQVAENITDYCTGVTDEWKPLDGTLESFVYGVGGGAQFSVAGMPGVVKQWHNGRVVKKQQREQFSQFANKDGRIVTARDLDDNPYYVLNEGGGMSIVVNDQGEKTAIATKDLKVESDEALDEHIARFNKEYVGKGMVTSDVAALNPGQDVTYSGESGRVQRVESDGTVVVEFGDPENGGHVERVSLSELSPAENTGTDNKNSQEVVQGTGQPDQQNTEQPNEGTAGQMEQKGQPSIPTQKDGTPDYNVLLEENPGVFAELWEKRSTPEKAKQALERQSNAITKKIEALQKKLENETDWNKVARIEDESAGLEARKAKVDEVISSRYAKILEAKVENVESVDVPDLNKGVDESNKKQYLQESASKKDVKKVMTPFQKELLELGSPSNVKEVIADAIARGVKVKMDDGNGSRGFSAHLGISQGSKEYKSFFNIRNEKEGFTPERLAENLLANDQSGLLSGMDSKELTDLIIDVIPQVSSRRRALDYMKKSRTDLAEGEQFRMEQLKHEDEMEEFGMSYEDWMVYMNIDAIEQQKALDTVNPIDFYSNFENEHVNNTENERNIQRSKRAEVPDSGRQDNGNWHENRNTDNSRSRENGERSVTINSKVGVREDGGSRSSENGYRESNNFDEQAMHVVSGENLVAEGESGTDRGDHLTDTNPKTDNIASGDNLTDESTLDSSDNYIQFNHSDGSVHYGEVTGTDKSRVVVKDSTGRTYRVQPESIISHYGSKQEMQKAADNAAKRNEDDVRFRAVESSEEQSIVDTAKKDGTYLKAPNGKDTSLSPKQWVQVRTKAFKEWFGDWEHDPSNASKVVDENGEPKVVYHNTNEKRTIFDTNFVRKAQEIEAHFFAPHSDKYGEYGKVENQCFLNLRNPSDFKTAYEGFSDKLAVSSIAGTEQREQLQSIGYDGGILSEDGFPYEYFVFSSSQIKSATDNVGTFSKDNADIRFREKGGIEEVNSLFNEELSILTEENADSKVFHLGMPSEALLSSGIPNKPFRLYGNKLLKKVKKHGFKPSDIRNLPIALENPIAVFVGSHKSSYAILTELEIGENKVLVSVETNKDGEIDFNLVSSVFGKSSRGVVDWVNSNKMRFSNKEKTLDYLSTSALSADATNNSEFDSATNIVKNFENPTLEEGEISSAIDNLSDELGVKVNRVKGRDELPEGIRRWMKSDRYPGMFDPKSGNVYVVMDEVLDAADAQATLLHEIVGHKGIHGLFGDRLPEFCERVLASMDEKKRTELVDRFRDEEEKRTEEAIRQLAAEEYVASFAEGYHDPGAWEKVKAIVKEFMRELGIDLKLSDNDLKYILWKAKNGLKDGDTAMDAISKIAKDKRVGDVLFRNADVQKAEKFADKKMSMAENVRIALQDSALAVKQLQDEIRRRGGKVADFADVYVEGMLATSRSKVAIENFDKEVFNPLIDVVSDIQKRGKSLEDIELYMMAKHASERNKVLFEKEGVENGSGLSDADANEIVKKFESDIPGALIDTLWNRVKSATGFTTKRWFEDGLIDKDTKELYDRQYKYYVPLRGWKESGDIDYVTSERRSGGVVNVNKQAHGRSSVADSPLAFIANMAHSAIVIGDKNRVKQNLFNLVVNNPQKDLYTVNRIYYVETEVDGKKTWLEQIEKPSQKLFDEGKVMTSINDEYKIARTTGQAKQHEVSLYRNGERYIIAFNGQKGVDVANAINGINRPDFSLFQNSIGAVTRWLSAAYTSKNPAFIPVNFLRDLGYAVPAYMIKGGNGINLSTNLTKAFGAIHADLSGKIKKDTELNRFYDEFKSNGGLTGFVHMTDVDTYKKNIERDLRKMAGRKSVSDIVFHNFALKKAGDMMEYMSQMSENSLRFAVYMTERQAGKSAKESAIAAKEITVNFNRKGTWSPFFGSFYAFFNASMQGGYNVANLAKHHPGKFAVAAAGFMAIQYFASQFARAFGGDDELGENYYDQLSDYIKYDHLVLPNVLNIGDGKFITIPLGHGFRAIGSIGVIAGEIITGNKSADKGVWELVNNLFDSFSPMQLNSFHLDEGDVINTLAGFTPTAMQPIVDVALNRDFTGRQVYKEPFMSKQKGRVAESNLGQKNTNPLLVDFTKWLNKTAGGDVYSATDLQMDDDGSLKRVPFFKWLDRNPAAIEHLIEGYAGGRGKFWNNLFKTVESAVTGKEIETNNIPVLRRLYQSPWEKSHWRIYFELRDEVGDFDFMSGAMKNARDFTSYRKLLQNSDQMRKVMMYKAYEKPIMKMNELIGAMDDDEMVEQLRLRREALVMELAKRVKQVKDK